MDFQFQGDAWYKRRKNSKTCRKWQEQPLTVGQCVLKFSVSLPSTPSFVALGPFQI